MITFESIGAIALTCSDIGIEAVIGKQVNTVSEGISPTYGMTADDMQMKTIVIRFTWSD